MRRDVGGALGRLPVEAEHAVRAVERRELRCILRRERAMVGGQELLRELRERRGGRAVRGGGQFLGGVGRMGDGKGEERI